MDLDALPSDQLERLSYYQIHRSLKEERERVEAALAVPEEERTTAERNRIAYSVYGSAAGCHCGY